MSKYAIRDITATLSPSWTRFANSKLIACISHSGTDISLSIIRISSMALCHLPPLPGIEMHVSLFGIHFLPDEGILYPVFVVYMKEDNDA